MRVPQLAWPRRAAGRIAVVGLVSVATILVGSVNAFAHVEVSPRTVTPGEEATIAFHVPNEREDVSTVRLEVVFPTDRPVTEAAPATLPGWTVTVAKQAAVTSIVWTGGVIQPGTYQEFPVSVAVPDGPGTLTFKALQTYSTGEVVRWIDVAEEGQPEPKHPAPAVSVAQAAAPPVAQPSTSDTVARVLGGA